MYPPVPPWVEPDGSGPRGSLLSTPPESTDPWRWRVPAAQVSGAAIEARKSGRHRHLASVRNAAGTDPEVLSVSLHQKTLWLVSPFLLLTILLLINSPAIGASLGSATLALPPTLDLTSISRKGHSGIKPKPSKTARRFRQSSRFVSSDKGRQAETQDKTGRTRPKSLAHTEGPLFGALFESSHH
ncbi:hypothetical protein HDV64DRAFT_123081 [Trichoderma sp. TUCIM 5745]